MTVTELAEKIGIKNVAQVRQWQHGYADRLPSPENCVAIERATNGVVMRWDLRPSDWHRIWPELIGIDGAPAIHTTEDKANPSPDLVSTEVAPAQVAIKTPAPQDAVSTPRRQNGRRVELKA